MVSSSVLLKADMLKPQVHGSELKSVNFYRSRHPDFRLDVAPFYIIYPAVVLTFLARAYSGNGYGA